MAKTKNNRSDRSAFSFDTARENPLAAAAAVGGAVAAGVFLWSRRNQISDQISQLSDQIGEWRSGGMNSDYEMPDAGDETQTQGHTSVLLDFIRAVDGGKEPETIGHDNIKSLSMVFGAIESARTGMPVDISV